MVSLLDPPIPAHGGSLFRSPVLGLLATLTLTGCGNDPPTDPGDSPSPTGLTAETGSDPGTIRLTWQPVAGATSYNVYWSDVPNIPAGAGEVVANASSPFIHSGLSSATSYYYSVTAVGPDGESPRSPEVTAVPDGDLRVGIVRPDRAFPVDEVVEVAVSVSSRFQLAGVSAELGAQGAPLVFDPEDERWKATFSLAQVASPSIQPLRVTATDVQGTTAQVARSLAYDRPPVVTVVSPASGSFASSSLRVLATCRDDSPGGCVNLTVRLYRRENFPIELSSGPDDVDQTISVADLDGEQAQIEAVGTDAALRHGYIPRTVTVSHNFFIETGGHLTPVATAGGGWIVDADADRLLVLDTVETVDSRVQRFHIVDRASGTKTLIFSEPNRVNVTPAALTPAGALVHGSAAGMLGEVLYEWRNGSLVMVSTADYVAGMLVKGDYAIWVERTTLFRRDLRAGTSTTISTDAANTDNDIAPNGDVVFWSTDYDLFRWHDGTTEPIVAGGVSRELSPMTDGVHVVYARSVDAFTTFAIVLADPGEDVVLASGFSEIISGRSYSVNDGWIAFTRSDLGNQSQIWLRSPAGVETQVSNFGSSSGIEQLGPAGEIVFRTPDRGASSRRYRATPGAAPVDIGSWSGNAIYIDGRLHVMMGSTLLRVD